MSDIKTRAVSLEPYSVTPAQLLNIGISPGIFNGEPGKSPYVDEEGYWWEYDVDQGQYKNTGILSDKNAADKALQAADTANQAAQDATAKAEAAAGKIDGAIEEATDRVDTAVEQANTAAQSANEAAGRVDDAITQASQAAQQATEAAETATGAGQTATDAAGEATQAAATANSAASAANEAADRANQAAAGAGLQKKVVDALPPAEEMADDTIYLVPSQSPGESNSYDEYLKIEGKAELIGSTATDLKDYVTKADLTSELSDYVQQAQLNNYAEKDALDAKADKPVLLTATIPAEGWAGESLQSVTVEVEGIQATDSPVIDVSLTGEAEADLATLKAWALITRITTSDGSITVEAAQAPTQAIPINIKVVR